MKVYNGKRSRLSNIFFRDLELTTRGATFMILLLRLIRPTHRDRIFYYVLEEEKNVDSYH